MHTKTLNPAAMALLPALLILLLLISCGNGGGSTSSGSVPAGSIAVSAFASPAQTSASGGSTITATVKKSDQPAPDGTKVVFSCSCGLLSEPQAGGATASTGSIAYIASTTSGVASAAWTAPGSSGTCSVTATSAGITSRVNVEVN